MYSGPRPSACPTDESLADTNYKERKTIMSAGRCPRINKANGRGHKDSVFRSGKVELKCETPAVPRGVRRALWGLGLGGAWAVAAGARRATPPLPRVPGPAAARAGTGGRASVQDGGGATGPQILPRGSKPRAHAATRLSAFAI